jgi:DNA-binding SARP family transcriptional activator/predicted negative regulator of RcsB-dependent stress response
MAERAHIRLLGRFAVDVDDRVVPDVAWRHRRGADLVKLLALQPNHRLHREQVMEALWPDLSPEQAAANLRKSIHYARRALGAESTVEVRGGVVALWPGGGELTTDVEALEAAARRASGSADGDAGTTPADLYPGDLLPDQPYEAWLLGPRERLRRLYVDVLRSAARWERLLEVDPTNEEAHRALMRAHFDAGNRQAAMRQFERLRRALHDELGVSPDEGTVALYQQVLAAEGAQPPTPAERARALLAQALVHWNRMELDGARRSAEEARAIAIDERLEPELGEASGLLGMVGNAQGRWQELFRDEFAQTLEQTPSMAGSVFDAHLCLAEFALNAASCDEISAFAEELLAVAEQRSSERGEALALLMLGEAELFAGRLAEAEGHLSRSAELHGRTGAVSGRALAIERLAEVALAHAHGRTRAAALLREARSLADDSPLSSHLLVRVYGAMVQQPREANRAASVAEWAGGQLAGADVCQPCSMGYLVAASTARARIGDTAGGRRHLEQAERVAGMWQGGSWHAAVWEARGHLRLAEGDPGQAKALFRVAAEGFAASGRGLVVGRCGAFVTPAR